MWEKRKGWAFCLMGRYDDFYENDKSRLDNYPSTYELYKMCSAVVEKISIGW